MIRRLSMLLGGAALAVALVACTPSEPLGGADRLPSAGGSSDAVSAESVPAPRFTAELTDGTEVDSADLFDGRVSLVQFMASWCTQCADQAQILTDAAGEYDGEVQVLFVAADNDEPEDLQGFLRDNATGVPVVLDADGQIFNRFAATEPPVTALIDAGGGIVRMWPGGAAADEIERELTQLLG